MSELQECMISYFNMLSSRINKGKAPKKVSAAISDLKDLTAFHQNVSVAMGTTLQHLADSLFVHMTNLILLHRDSYLEYVKNGIKPDTYSHLRNAPVFRHGLFPDAVSISRAGHCKLSNHWHCSQTRSRCCATGRMEVLS